MSIELKIKSKHLSEEAKIIRFEENKLLKQVAYQRSKHKETGNNSVFNHWALAEFKSYKSLNKHRRVDVRHENRATYLARAYLTGVPYTKVEQKRKEEKEYEFCAFILPRVAAMLAKYGEKKIQKKIWQGSYPERKEVTNPEFLQLEKDIKEWSKL